MLKVCVLWCKQAGASRQHFLFMAWENEECSSSEEGAFLGLDCLNGNLRDSMPPNHFLRFSSFFVYKKLTYGFSISINYKIV